MCTEDLCGTLRSSLCYGGSRERNIVRKDENTGLCRCHPKTFRELMKMTER